MARGTSGPRVPASLSAAVIVRPAADLDLQDAFEWSETIEVGLGPRFTANVDRVIQVLEQQPFAFPIYYRNTRRAIVQQSPYVLYHVSKVDRVFIVACFSGHRDSRWVRRALRARGGA